MKTLEEEAQGIMATALAFWSSKVLLVAVELGVFDVVDEGATQEAVRVALRLGERGVADFLDALVAMGLLQRDGTAADAVYSTTPHTARLLVSGSNDYMGGVLKMTNDRLYPFWAHLEEALRTGQPQNESKRSGAGWYETLYADPAKLEQFMSAMAGYQIFNFRRLVERFDFSAHESFCDIGGASGALAIEVARAHPSVRCATFDLPAVAPIAQRNIDAERVAGKVEVRSGNFWTDELPQADVLCMGNILHNWSSDEKTALIAKAHGALPRGGVLLALEHVVDDDRRGPLPSLLMSLDMQIESVAGFEATRSQFRAWCADAGFSSVSFLPLVGSTCAVTATK